LLQIEAIIMFWGNISGLWWLILALVVTAVIFVRMGIKVFNREELIGQDIDQIRVAWIWRQFWDRFTARASSGRYSLRGWFKQLFSLRAELRWPAAALLTALFVGLALGFYMASLYDLPTGNSAGLSGSQIAANTSQMQLLYNELPLTIFMQNVRVLILVAVLGVITLGVTDVLLFMLPWIVVGFLAGQVGAAGESALLFILAAVAPHALLEVPALLLVIGAALRWHAAVMARPPRGTVSERWINNAADFWMVFLGLGLPLLLAAAYVEAHITPQLILLAFGD
jgi:uncharacterized membrane protein SpoIIM required for sporulation